MVELSKWATLIKLVGEKVKLMGFQLLATSKRQLALIETGKEPYDLDVSFQDTFEFLKKL